VSEPDLVVVGGGPAGSALAAMAAGAGARVVLVERDSFPRDKVCGEFLSAEGCAVLRQLGALDTLVEKGAPWMDAWCVTHPDGGTLSTPLPEIPGAGRAALGVTRELLDTTLLDVARSRGVEVFERVEVTAPVVEDGAVVAVRTRRVGRARSGDALRGRVVVAADGRRSFLVRALDPGAGDPRRTTIGSWFGLKVHLEGGAPPPGRVELHLFDGGYVGLAPVEGRRINLCLLVRVGALRACGGSPERLLRERILRSPGAARVLEGATVVSDWKSIGPLRFGARRMTIAGALLVGDAAGTVDPFAGEGMANALRGAEIALPVALEAAARGGVDPGLARRYRRAWTRAIRPATRRARGLGFLFAHPRLAGIALRLLSGTGRTLLPILVASTRTGGTARVRE
jgi:flavin-dependent dehydrogenase